MGIDLGGKICLVTGAAKGIGRGICLGFARRGAHVFAGCRCPRNDAVFDSAGITQIPMDVTRPEQVSAAVERIERDCGRIDVLINNAGVYPRQDFAEMTEADWRNVLDVNLHGAWRCAHAVAAGMSKQGSGSIINVGSVEFNFVPSRHVHYLASKGGLVGLTRALARELGPDGVRVNLLHVGAVRTEGELALGLDAAELERDLNAKQCLTGRQTPETVEPTFAFFASEASGDVTGQCLTVDHGWTHG